MNNVKRKNVAIMVMAANMEPSTRNLEAIKDTMVKYHHDNKDVLKHNYDWYFYWCDNTIDQEVVVEKSDEYDNLYLMKVRDEESVYRTFEKTIKVFDYVSRMTQTDGETEKPYYDWYVRINISMFLNLRLLDAAINVLKPDRIYGNALNSIVNLNSRFCNDLYVRGDLMVFDKGVMEGILKHALKYMYSDLNMKVRDGVDHVDDCLIGCCFIDHIGEEYYKNLYMFDYQYFPQSDVSEIDVLEMNPYCIGARVKTVPPTETYSGYSWEDNEFRKMDGVKMHKLYDWMCGQKKDYMALQVRDLLVDKKESRPTLFISASNQNVYDVFYKYLEQKYAAIRQQGKKN